MAVGAAAESVYGLRVPREGSLSGRVFTTGTPLRMAAPDERADLQAAVPDGLDAGPVLVVPLVGSHTTHGVLSVVRLRGRAAFTAEDLDMATGFANQASVALELARARADQQRAALLDERERIAADLHDHVIQRLFASGLSLQALAATLGPGRATDRVLATVADLDATISQIRTAIFALQQAAAGRCHAACAPACSRWSPTSPRPSGSSPPCGSPACSTPFPTRVADDLLAVLREALTNAARHAHATAVEVELTATADQAHPRRPRQRLRHRRHHPPQRPGQPPPPRRTPRRRPHRRTPAPTGTRLVWTVPFG